MSSLVGKEAADLFNKYYELISSESDRGAVILVGSILDVALEKLISSFLLLPIKKQDKLLNGSYAPLGSFSAKIEVSYRLGLIRLEILEQLQLFKGIRNDFAHRINDARLDSFENENRIQEIFKKTPEIENVIFLTVSKNLKEAGLNDKSENLIDSIGARHSFDLVFSGVCMALERISLDVKRIEPLV